jgi:hypothetical protein
VYRIFDSAWTQRTDGVSSRPDEGSVQADSWRTGFALQVESKAGSRNPDPAATDQCASPAGAEKAAPQQYRSFSVCLVLPLVPLRPWRDCDCQAGDDHSLAPRWVSSVLALAIAQPWPFAAVKSHAIRSIGNAHRACWSATGSCGCRGHRRCDQSGWLVSP